MRGGWNWSKDDFLPDPFQNSPGRAKTPYQIGVLVVSEGGLERPQSHRHDPKSVESLFGNPF